MSTISCPCKLFRTELDKNSWYNKKSGLCEAPFTLNGAVIVGCGNFYADHPFAPTLTTQGNYCYFNIYKI